MRGVTFYLLLSCLNDRVPILLMLYFRHFSLKSFHIPDFLINFFLFQLSTKPSNGVARSVSAPFNQTPLLENHHFVLFVLVKFCAFFDVSFGSFFLKMKIDVMIFGTNVNPQMTKLGPKIKSLLFSRLD